MGHRVNKFTYDDLWLGVWWVMSLKGFWNDPGGLTIDEFAALLVLPLFLFVGVKLALAGEEITSVQVDFFTVLTYPILAVVARQAVERFGFPVIGRKQTYSTGYTEEGGTYEGSDLKINNSKSNDELALYISTKTIMLTYLILVQYHQVQQ